MKQEVISQVYQALPAGATIYMGLTINDLGVVVGIAFIALQAAYLIWKWIKEIRDKKDK